MVANHGLRSHAREAVLKTALRQAVEGFMCLPQQRVTVEQVSNAAPVSLRAVRGYLRRLTSERVLRLLPDTIIYTAGRRLRRWLLTEPRTTVGGNASAYLQARKLRDQQLTREYQLIRAAQIRRQVYGDD